MKLWKHRKYYLPAVGLAAEALLRLDLYEFVTVGFAFGFLESSMASSCSNHCLLNCILKKWFYMLNKLETILYFSLPEKEISRAVCNLYSISGSLGFFVRDHLRFPAAGQLTNTKETQSTLLTWEHIQSGGKCLLDSNFCLFGRELSKNLEIIRYRKC